MGIHLLVPGPGGRDLVPTEPEALLYEKRNDGRYKLTGVEYVVAGGPRPTLYGQPFVATNLARFGDPGRPSGRFTRGSGSGTATGCRALEHAGHLRRVS